MEHFTWLEENMMPVLKHIDNLREARLYVRTKIESMVKDDQSGVLRAFAWQLAIICGRQVMGLSRLDVYILRGPVGVDDDKGLASHKRIWKLMTAGCAQRPASLPTRQ